MRADDDAEDAKSSGRYMNYWEIEELELNRSSGKNDEDAMKMISEGERGMMEQPNDGRRCR